MSVSKAGLWRAAVVSLVAGAVLASPMGAKASDVTNGLSVRVGAFVPQRTDVRGITDFAAWGAGVDYKAKFIPHVFNGENWSSSISVDGFYAGRKAGVLRNVVASINQVYTFEEQHGKTPYAGFCFSAATSGGTMNGTSSSTSNQGVSSRATTFGGKQPTVTRFGGGLIVGLNWGKSLYFDARYEWIDAKGSAISPEGIRGSLGYRF